jgi:hypothetical protein
MKMPLSMAAAFCATALATASAAPHPQLPFGNMRLIEEIDCGAPAPTSAFAEMPKGVSKVETILGKKARVLPNPKGADMRYFAYLIGKGKNLQGGKAYVLQVEFADNAPRTFFIRNSAESITRGVFTGTDVGDAINPHYVNANPESLDIPLSNSWMTWTSHFFMHDRYFGLGGWPRGEDEHKHPEMKPRDGFWVVIGQLDQEQAPLSQGAAVSSIRLYEAPPENETAVKLRYPGNLPRRHLFWREEMSDSVVSGKDKERFQTINRLDWYENKARRMKFLGMNTYAIDLLEFGSNQGWDSDPGGGNDWYYQTPFPDTWEKILGFLSKYELEALPYYEYHGSIGNRGLGNQKRAKPLDDKLETYTHIVWAEKARANILDPDTEEDLKKLFDLTIVKFKNRAKFLGAWLRPRNSGIPISFADSDIELFSKEANDGKPVTRKALQQKGDLYEKYIAWWYTKRRDFLVRMQEYLAGKGLGSDVRILFTTDPSEPGFDYTQGMDKMVAENPSLWRRVGISAMKPEEALRLERHRKALTLPQSTWGEWEWQHSVPKNDPQNYKDVEGVALTYTFNRLYTVSDPKLLEDFTGKAGLAIVRHFSLNENMMSKDGKKQTIGYFVADFERAGPYCMASEATAMANADPYYIGYLSGERYAPGFPQYVRAFNQAFLALPALPSERLRSASSDKDVVVREIKTSEGTYYAVINTARVDKPVTLNLPAQGQVINAATGEVIAPSGTDLKGAMYPYQLLAFLVK